MSCGNGNLRRSLDEQWERRDALVISKACRLNGGGARRGKVGRCTLKWSRALHVTSFPSKETDNMDGRYDLPTLDKLGVYRQFLNSRHQKTQMSGSLAG
jgi:hypothetical protein